MCVKATIIVKNFKENTAQFFKMPLKKKDTSHYLCENVDTCASVNGCYMGLEHEWCPLKLQHL